jgi:L-fucose mutarotase/ribose pyranase (RbsD/FucU family)
MHLFLHRLASEHSDATIIAEPSFPAKVVGKKCLRVSNYRWTQIDRRTIIVEVPLLGTTVFPA